MVGGGMSIKVNRKQLFDLVWSKPMVEVAAEYGVSDVAFAKLCKKHNVPRPPRGYWAKVKAGQRPRKEKLPRGDSKATIHLRDPDEVLATDRKKRDAVHPEPEAKIVVKANLRGCHLLVRETKENLLDSKKGDDGIFPSTKGPLDIQVSKESRQRALLLMDALIKALAERGHQVTPGPSVHIQGQEISFSISEKTEKIKSEPEEHPLEGRYEFGHSRFTTRHQPTGKLTLSISDTGYWSNGIRKSWSDGKKQNLENVLNRFLRGLVDFAVAKNEEAARVKVREAERAEAARVKQERTLAIRERRELQKQEQAKFDRLMEQLKAWQKSRDLKLFAEAVAAANQASSPAVPSDNGCDEWIQFALTQAERLNPLIASPPSILDEEIPEEPRRWGY